MKQLCQTWRCVRTVKLVNNLKVFTNSRFDARDGNTNTIITVTAFDYRYPRWCVYVIHIVQHFGIASYSSFALGVLALALFVMVGLRLKSIRNEHKKLQ